MCRPSHLYLDVQGLAQRRRQAARQFFPDPEALLLCPSLLLLGDLVPLVDVGESVANGARIRGIS